VCCKIIDSMRYAIHDSYHSVEHFLVVAFVADAVAAVVGAALAEQPEILEAHAVAEQGLLFLRGGAGQELVEDVVIPFAAAGVDEPNLLQQVRFDRSSR